MIERLAISFASLRELIWTRLSRISARTRWSLIDQVLVSGANVLTGIILVRSLGLLDFGIFSLAYIGIHFVWGFQAGISGSMMSLFDQRGSTSQSSYLATVFLHQTVLGCALAIAVCLAPILIPQIKTVVPVNFPLVAAVIVAFQYQDLARRFFYVTERPVHAFLCDFIAYGVRLMVVGWLALEGELTLDRVWIVITLTGLAALMLVVPDFFRGSASWPEIREISRRQLKVGGWLVGNTLTAWFTDSGFILLIVGTVLGPVQVGAARAVQNLVNLANLLTQSLENFVPSAAARALVDGGVHPMLRYVYWMSLFGAAGISLMTLTLMLFADPILGFVYGRTFPYAVTITGLLGGFVALAYVGSVVVAGLRALEHVRTAFFVQAGIGVVSVATAWPIAAEWGVVGSLTGLLVGRFALTAVLVLLLARHARGVG